MPQIHGWMDDLAAANPDWVSVETIGKSYQNRDLKVIRINPGNSATKFWIDGGSVFASYVPFKELTQTDSRPLDQYSYI